MADPAARAAWVNMHVDADLQFVFQESGIEGLQYTLGQHYRTIRHFSAIADDRPGVPWKQTSKLGLTVRATERGLRLLFQLGTLQSITTRKMWKSAKRQRGWGFHVPTTHKPFSDATCSGASKMNRDRWEGAALHWTHRDDPWGDWAGRDRGTFVGWGD